MTAATAERPGVAEAATRLLGRVFDSSAGPLFAALRRTDPVLQVGPVTVVVLRRDVEEVLGDPVRFPVELYGPKMTAVTGPFLLGLDDTPLYRHDHAALDRAFRPTDLPEVAATTLAQARARVDGALAGGLDVVGALADPVLDAVVGQYAGVRGPDPQTHVRWAREVFEELFIDVGDVPAVRDRALATAALWRPHLDAQVDARRAALAAGEPVPDDVLTRLLRDRDARGPEGLSDVAVRHNLLGLVTGWLPTISNAFARVVEELLRRPDALEGAQAAARAGDTDAVGAHVFEASRFRPQNVALLRRAAVDTVLAAGTPRETAVAAGSLVVAATLSGMHDPAAVEEPGRFRTDRAWPDPLLFGSGLHACYGRHLVRVQLPALATALLEGPPLVRGSRLSFSGPFPARLVVRAGRSLRR